MKIKRVLSMRLCIINHSVFIVTKYVSALNTAADETKHIVNAHCTLLTV
jgi:hypothetical protein